MNDLFKSAKIRKPKVKVNQWQLNKKTDSPRPFRFLEIEINHARAHKRYTSANNRVHDSASF